MSFALTISLGFTVTKVATELWIRVCSMRWSARSHPNFELNNIGLNCLPQWKGVVTSELLPSVLRIETTAEKSGQPKMIMVHLRTLVKILCLWPEPTHWAVFNVEILAWYSTMWQLPSRFTCANIIFRSIPKSKMSRTVRRTCITLHFSNHRCSVFG